MHSHELETKCMCQTQSIHFSDRGKQHNDSTTFFSMNSMQISYDAIKQPIRMSESILQTYRVVLMILVIYYFLILELKKNVRCTVHSYKPQPTTNLLLTSVNAELL